MCQITPQRCPLNFNLFIICPTTPQKKNQQLSVTLVLQYTTKKYVKFYLRYRVSYIS
jgi:hypothetical protein